MQLNTTHSPREMISCGGGVRYQQLLYLLSHLFCTSTPVLL